MKRYFIWLLFSFILCSSCDPVRAFKVQAYQEDSQISIYIKPSQEERYGLSSESNPIEVSKKNNPEFFTHFSIGKWNSESVQDLLTQHIDSIIITSHQRKEYYRSPESIQKFLLANQQFFHKNVIIIKR